MEADSLARPKDATLGSAFATSEKLELLALPVSKTAGRRAIIDSVAAALQAGRPYIGTFVNPYSCHVAKTTQGYVEDLAAFDGVFCDGIGMVMAARVLGKGVIERISFDSTALAPWLLEFCALGGHPLFLVGGKEGVAMRASETMREEFPALTFAGTRSGYFKSTADVVQEIVSSGARVVVCGMGIPHQERFLLALVDAGWQGAAFTCGGYLDQLAGGFQYYPAWIDRLNLRFLYRLVSEPSRLWRRYLIEYQAFFRALVRDLRAK